MEMPDKSQWLQDATNRMQAKGTVGSLSAAAKREGKSPMSFARQTKASPTASPAMKKKANFAINAQK